MGLPRYVGQAMIDALMAMGKLPVVEPEQMQQRCLEIVYVNWISDWIPTDLVRFAVDRASFRSTTCHKDGKGIGVMVASCNGGVANSVLAQRRAPEFAGPHDKCFFEQPSLLKVFDEGGDWLICHRRVVSNPLV